MAKAPTSGTETIEDAELLASVDASDPDRPPTLLPEPERDLSPPEPPVMTSEPPPAEAPASRAPVPPARQGSFVPLVLGGALVAVAGFAASHLNLLNLTTPGGSAAALETQVAAQADQIAALSSRLDEAAQAPAPADPALAERLAAVEDSLAALQAAPAPATADLGPVTARLQQLESDLAAIAAMPPGEGGGVAPAALVALQAEVAALKSAGGDQSEELERLAAEAEARISEAETRATALQDSIAASVQAATSRAAVGRLQASLETGAPFTTALADLGEGDLPAVLTDAAAQGLPTVQSLRESFPAAARAALEAALRANMGESWTERVGTFLRTQTGARSLEPREGSDPDAILSRAEAALAAGDLATAVTEVRTLPEPGLAAMADWLALADRRLAAEAAVADLALKHAN